MTPQQIRDVIQQHGLLGSAQDIADAINAMGLRRPVPTLGGIGYILRTLGPNEGAELLDGLENLGATVPPVRWAMRVIERGELDFGDAVTRQMIDQLCPPLAAAALKAAAEVPDTVTATEVAEAMTA